MTSFPGTRLSPRSRVRVAAAACLAAVLALTACGGGDDNQPTTTTAPETTVPSTTAAPSTTAPVGEVPDVTAAPRSDSTTRLTGVDVAGEPGAGKVTFTFNGAVPGYTIGYTTLPPRQDGSGNPVSLQGDAGIALRFSPSSAVDLTGGLHKTYNGRERISGAADSNIAELAQVSDYEGSLTWALGVRSKARFTVTALEGPSRVVVQLEK